MTKVEQYLVDEARTRVRILEERLTNFRERKERGEHISSHERGARTRDVTALIRAQNALAEAERAFAPNARVPSTKR